MKQSLTCRFELEALPLFPRTTAAVLSIVLAATSFSPAVCAQAGAEAAEPSPARQLFLEGRRLAAAGKYSEACPKFEESLRLELGVGTQFNLADCWEHIGRNASAQALFLGAAASAKATGQLDREQVLRDRAAALEPRLSRLVIDVAATDPKLSVKRGELPLEAESWGKAIAVDPGKYTVIAKAPGKQTWQKTVDITAATPLVTVEVPELEPAAPKVVVPPTRPVVEKRPAAAAPSPVASDRGGAGLNYRALSVAGLGVAAIGVGTFMGFKYRSANQDAKEICPSSRNCTIKQIQDHDRLVDDARTARRWSYAGFGVGGAALLGAAALWYFQRPKPGTAARLQAVPVVAADGSLGATLSGSF